jgi:hypothetical protein
MHSLQGQNSISTVQSREAFGENISFDFERSGAREVFLEEHNAVDALVIKQAVVACRDFPA